MESDEIIIIEPLDILAGNSIDVIGEVERQIAPNFEQSLENFKRFYHALRLAGTMLAHFLYRLFQQYIEDYQKTINDFAHVMYAEVGISPETTIKYVNVWRWIFENPHLTKEDKEKLIEQPIRKLILAYPALRDGDISADEVVEAPTLYDLRQKIKERVGERTSGATASYYTLNLNTGELVFRRGELSTTIGILNVFDHTDTLREEGIERLIKALGVLLQ